MKKLSMKSITKTKSSLLGIATSGASLCLAIVLATSWNVSALEAAEATPSAQADIQAKAPVGEANAEANAAADPINACGPAPRDKDGSAWGKYFKVNHVNMRKSPSTNSTICAQGQKSHKVDYHCWKVGADGHTWTYLRDVTTHYAGWVRDDLLVGNGSLVHC